MALSDWKSTNDENGNIYYYNIITNETAWEIPQEEEQTMPSRRKSALGLIQEAVSAQITESPWIEKWSEKKQKKYWKHNVTGETTWKEPVVEITMTQTNDSNTLTDATINESNDIIVESPWIEKWSEKKQKKYWKHNITGETTWKEPVVEPVVVEITETPTNNSNNLDSNVIESTNVIQESDWEEKFSKKHQRTFWKHKQSGETTWKDPTVSIQTGVSLVSSSLAKKNTSETVQAYRCFVWYFYGLEQVSMLESNRSFIEINSSSINISFSQESGRRSIKVDILNIAKVTVNKISCSIIVTENPTKTGQTSTHCFKSSSAEETELISNTLSRRLIAAGNNKVEMVEKSTGYLLYPQEATSLSRSYCMRKLSSRVLESEYDSLYTYHQSLLENVTDENVDKHLLQRMLEDVDKEEHQEPMDFSQNKNIPIHGIVVAKVHGIDSNETVANFNPYWIKIDRKTKTISFHIHGQGSVPYFTVDTSEAILNVNDLREEVELTFTILNGKIKGQLDEVEISFVFHSVTELWRWVVAIGTISREVITTNQSQIPFNPSNNAISKTAFKSNVWNQDILDAALSVISMIADRHIVQNLFRVSSVSGHTFSTTKFTRINSNLVLTSKGTTELIEGSVLLAINGLSMIVDSHQVVKFFPDLPKQHPVEVKLFKFPQSDYQVQVCIMQQDNNNSNNGLIWTESKAYFTESNFIIKIGNTEIARIKLAACQIRLVALKNGVLDLALEAQDSECHILVTLGYVRNLLDLVEHFIQGMKFMGSINVDFGDLFGKAESSKTTSLKLPDSPTLSKLAVSPGKSIEGNTSPDKVSAYDDTLNDDTQVDFVHSMLVAAEDLESTITSLNIPVIFPSPSAVTSLLQNLAIANKENHETLANLISMEKVNDALSNTLILSEEEIQNCSKFIFYLRDHPKDIVSLSKTFNYENNLILAGIIVNRICNNWSSDMNSLRKFLEQAILLDNEISHHDFHIPSLESKTFLNVLIDEIGMSVEIVSFVEHICSGSIVYESITTDSRIGDICSLMVEPLCQRLEIAAISGMIPTLLLQTTAALSSVKGRLSMEDIFSEMLIPRIVNRIFSNTRTNSMIVTRIVNLLRICFGRNPHPNLVLSLSDTAALSRSKWLISRFLDALRVLQKSSVHEPSPIASISGIKIGEYKPHAVTDIICIHTSELHFILQSLHNYTETAKLELLNLPRDISAVYFAILNADVIDRLSSASSSELPTLLLVNSQQNNYSDLETKENHDNVPGNSELASIVWLVNAARSTLKLVYEVEDWSNKGLVQKYRASLRELSLLRDQLTKKQAAVSACIKDFQILEMYLNVLHGYRYQMEICKENLLHSKDNNVGEISNALLQTYHNQMTMEVQMRELREAQNRMNFNFSPSKKGSSSPTKRNNSYDINEMKPIVGENPLMLVMHLFSSKQQK